jgi:hypothetical protein
VEVGNLEGEEPVRWVAAVVMIQGLEVVEAEEGPILAGGAVVET